jgi:peptidoglycan/LPS O-acetylase OafA/YrhL
VAVVLCHVGHGFANARSLTVAEAYGCAGVSFFFMLSGFVLTWSDRPQTARRFWWLRFGLGPPQPHLRRRQRRDLVAVRGDVLLPGLPVRHRGPAAAARPRPRGDRRGHPRAHGVLLLIVAQAGVDTCSNLYYWLFFVFPPYRFGEFLLGMLRPGHDPRPAHPRSG